MPKAFYRIVRILVACTAILCVQQQAFAQLTVTGGLTANAMAQILAGPGITVSNATLTGSPLAGGSFNGTASNIGMPSGVILCTGPVTIAPGPNNAAGAGEDNSQLGNAQLNGLAGAATFNAIVLEFDFVPLSNTIEFDYVFGSEEYPEFVNSGFNDAFAFFISGPGIAGQQNIARVPGTALPVTIDNINTGSNAQYYVNNAGGATVQYDGFTTVLTATSTVQACETYHLKLMIADGGDQYWDSGVFLAEGSLTSAVVEITTTTATADSTAYENCSNATVTFTLSEILSTPFTVNYSVTGTATNGVDFPTIPTTVTIPAGSLSTSFLIEPGFDGVAEGIETVIIDVQTSVCGSDTILIFINDVTPVTVEAFGDTAFCGGTAKLWAHAQGGAGSHTYQWSNGMTTDTIYVNPTTTTTYTVTANDYCASTVPTPTASATVTIDPTPVANAGPDIPYCAGDPVTLSGTDGADYHWFDITNNAIVGTTASITLNPVGDVDYRMITLNGMCSDTDFVSITELPASPAAAVGDTSFCAGGTAQLNVVGAAGATFSWLPTTGLSNPLIQNPTATPATNTTYTVTVTSSSGCIKTDSVVVGIEPGPSVDFSVQDVCLNQTSAFINLTTISSGSIQSLDWDFGDATTSAAYAPTHTYGTDGTYTVKLVAVSAMGCADSITHTATVNPLPVATFNFQNDCQDKLIAFINQSTVASGQINAWNWDFGNSNTSAVQNPMAQSYPAAGLYQVQLIVQTQAGCSDDTTQTIEIYPVPTAAFSFDSVCLGFENQFTDLSNANGNYPINNWNWVFSDGQTSSLSNPSVEFLQHGFYNATLTVTTAAGCVNALNAGNAVVHPLPVSQFSNVIKNCLNDTTWFEDMSSVSNQLNDVITDWEWNFADGSYATNPDTNHVYALHGLYPVSLITVTNKGCTDTVSHQVEIFPLPVVAFTSDVTEGCQPLRVQFEELVTIPSPYTISQYTWNLGDGDGAITTQNPMNVYHSDTLGDLSIATYTVSLRATSGNGCVTSDTVTNYITEFPKPDALFAADDYIVDVLSTEISFTDKSSENVTEWYYDFGDGNSSTDENPTNRFPVIVDEYLVTQYVTTQYGCMDTISATVKVEPIFTFYVPNSFTPNADGVNEEFYGDGEGYKSYSMYIYDRWGELLFVSNDRYHTWDGTYKDQQVELGTYTYYFYIVDWKNDDHEYRGHVTLMR
ncbi:MAG: choice-of-anchor L domain-containing protein [Flavobacteriales bacterium]|nr:choice-of-anchor L domain-containing protein [Flavobacteriales bacterium]